MPTPNPTTPPAERRHLRLVKHREAPRVYAEQLCAAGCGRWCQVYTGDYCVFCRGEPRE